MQAAATRADEDELGAVVTRGAGAEITDAHVPAAGGFFEIGDAVVARDAATGLAREPSEEFAGDVAEIHVGARVHLGRSDGPLGALLGEQRSPAADGRAIGRVFHRAEKMVRGEAGVAGFEIIHLILPVDKAEVLDRVDELFGLIDHALGDGVAPKLFGAFELLKNFDRVADVDRAVGFAVGRVTEFANTGVAGAGVVPAVGTFLGEVLGHFVDLERKLRIEAFEQSGEVGGHDAAAD